MRILVYEHLTALGLGRDPSDPMHGMYREGLAMRDALAMDLSSNEPPGSTRRAFETLNSRRDEPGGSLSIAFDEKEEHDHAIVIAPETDGVMLQLQKQFSSRWLGCSPETIALTTDKLALAEHWRKHGVRTPATTDREPTPCEAFPVVWKPRDGCGSTATFLLKDHFDLTRAKATLPNEHTGPMILQEFIPGRATSLSFLCGPAGNVPLIPSFQHLSTDGRFHYCGGELPLPADLAERAFALGTRAVNCVPGLCGYVGVDLILGDDADWAVEINPRLTTSYIGLRAAAEFNIAAEWLRIALGGSPRELRWKQAAVHFTAYGTCRPRASHDSSGVLPT